jgi:hypothetical protein
LTKKEPARIVRVNNHVPPCTPKKTIKKTIKKQGLLTPAPSPAKGHIPFLPCEYLNDAYQNTPPFQEKQDEDSVNEGDTIVIDTIHICHTGFPVWQKIPKDV